MMIRIIASNRSVEIDDPGNFRSFSVRIDGRFDDPALQAALLGRVAVSSDREHAWISGRRCVNGRSSNRKPGGRTG
jgi:hypothetical protein